MLRVLTQESETLLEVKAVEVIDTEPQNLFSIIGVTEWGQRYLLGEYIGGREDAVIVLNYAAHWINTNPTKVLVMPTQKWLETQKEEREDEILLSKLNTAPE